MDSTQREERREGERVFQHTRDNNKDNKKESVWRENKCLRRKCWGVNIL